jgi:predicted ferric reductase
VRAPVIDSIAAVIASIAPIRVTVSASVANAYGSANSLVIAAMWIGIGMVIAAAVRDHFMFREMVAIRRAIVMVFVVSMISTVLVIFTFMVSMIIVRVIIPIPIPWVIAPIIITPIPWVIIKVRITRIVTGLSVITRCLVNYIDRDLIARLASQNVR